MKTVDIFVLRYEGGERGNRQLVNDKEVRIGSNQLPLPRAETHKLGLSAEEIAMFVEDILSAADPSLAVTIHHLEHNDTSPLAAPFTLMAYSDDIIIADDITTFEEARKGANEFIYDDGSSPGVLIVNRWWNTVFQLLEVEQGKLWECTRR